MQVDCTPPGNLEIRVLEYRSTSGGYLKITPWQTASIAAVSKIAFKQSSADVSTYSPPCCINVILPSHTGLTPLICIPRDGIVSLVKLV